MGQRNRRFKIVLTGIVLGLITYALSYLYFRKQHQIVHYRAYSISNIHRVEATWPDGPSVFMAVTQITSDTSDFGRILDKTYKHIENKVAFLNCFYYPARKLEVGYWNIFDRK